MRKTKRLTSLFIILTLVVSMFTFSVPVLAEESLPAVMVTDEDMSLAMKLKTLGVITNEFEMGAYVTRGEMASITAYYISVPGSNTKCFADVSAEHPYYGEIGALYNLGIITGDDKGNFNPDKYVTYDEALVFIINAVGHKPFAVREGGYPTGYHRIAIKHNMLNGLSMQKGTDAATFADIYKMLEKGLVAATVDTQYYGDGSITYTLSDSETFLSTTYKIRKFRGIVTGTKTTKLTSAVSNIDDGQIEIDGKTYDIVGYGNKNFLGRCIEFYISTDDEDVILYAEEAPKYNETIRIDSEDILKSKVTDTRIYYSDDNDDEHNIDFKSTISVIYNEQCYTSYGVLSSIMPKMGYVEALDNNRDGKYDVLFIYDYKSIVAGTIDSYDETVVDELTGTKYYFSQQNGRTVAVRFVGQRDNVGFEGITTEDVLSIAESKLSPKVINVYVSREYVTGKIEGYQSNKGWLIGDEWYEETVGYEGTELAVGMSGKFFLDMNNKIVKYRQGSSDENEKLAVVAGLDYKLTNLTNRITVKLFTEDEQFVDADLKENVRINGNKFDISQKDKAEEALGIIGTLTNGVYKINSAYVVVYKLDSNGCISYLDLGGIRGPGKLNKYTDAGTSMLVRPNYILAYKDDSDVDTMARWNTSDGVIFAAPSDGELDELKQYSVFKNFRTNHYYQVNSTQWTSLDTYAVYSFEENTIPMADVILFRGMGAQGSVTRSSPMGVITEVSLAVNAEGEQTRRVYFGNESYMLKSEISFTKNGTTADVETGDIASQLVSGTAVQYVVDNNGEISAIKVIADYNPTTKVVTPAFASASVYIEDNYYAAAGEMNIIVGKVVENDPVTSQLIFTTNGTDRYLLYTSGANVEIYRSGEKKVTDASIQDLVPTDQFVCRTISYFIPKDMIVYR